MAVDRSGVNTTSVRTEDRDLVMERVFAAPRDALWRAYTEPERLLRWWGPRGTTVTVHQLDLRVDGAWRFVNHGADGADAPFKGVYREIVAPERIVYTSVFDVEGFRDREAIVTETFEEQAEGTKVVTQTRFPAVEDLERAMSMGMAADAAESWERLAEQLAAT